MASTETMEEAKINYLAVLREGELQRREQRRKFSIAIFALAGAWLVVATVLLFLKGFSIICLTDTVLIGVLTTTSANVLGILLVVTKYLFSPPSISVEQLSMTPGRGGSDAV